ncbi:MAG: 6,7-dimethyl-8-ribityllumazine synthase [Saprospiraceae bacterium]|nr:6,7-dimethyl-8-ribityllumazine synthase [Saprospiraceae bacterium]
MASSIKNLSTYDEKNIPEGKAFNIGIIVSDWNSDITHALYDGCFDTLIKHGVEEKNIRTVQVPGTFELPTAARLMLSRSNVDAVICIGCVIKGETKHDEYINHAVATGITNLSLTSGKPVIFGVLTPNNHQQAVDRAGGKHGNKGVEAAVTALRMADLHKNYKENEPKGRIGF